MAATCRNGHIPKATQPPEMEKASLEFTQRLERKLAEYNASNNVFKRWLFEMVCWLTSAACMAAIIFVYIRIKNRPIIEKGTSTLLTLANVLGKVSSAALIVPTSEALGQLKWHWFHNSNALWDFEIFDKASRGPLGAMMLLFRTKGRSLAALGALLILLLLAIDTFFQQVIDLPDRWALQETASEVPKTIWYEPGLGEVFREGVVASQPDDDIFLLIGKYSYGNGTRSVPSGNGTRPDISLSCPTSNCTWPEYQTLGVCSQCEDISSLLEFACMPHKNDWSSHMYGGFGVEEFFPNTTMCGYFLNLTSTQPVFMSGYMQNSGGKLSGETLLARMLPLTTLYTREPLYGNGSIHFKQLRNTIADVLIVSAAENATADNFRSKPPVAHECVLAWCVKTIQSSYYSGRYEENVLNTIYNTTPGTHPWVSYPFETENENGTDIFYLQDVNIDIKSPAGTISTFGTSNTTASAIIMSFRDIFPAFTTLANNSTVQIMRYKTWSTGPPWLRTLDFNPWLALNNITRHMERLAIGMTNEFRSVEGNVDTVFGSSFSREVFVHVKWEWLTFPVVLLVMSLIFLVSTIIKTSKETTTGFWKTSTMPTLIYGLPHEVQREFSPDTWDNASRKKHRQIRIKLLPNQGWRVSGEVKMSDPQVIVRAQRPYPAWI